MVIGQLDTGNWEFMAVGTDRDEVEGLLRNGYNRHCREYLRSTGYRPDYTFDFLKDGIRYTDNVKMRQVFRDSCLI